MAVIGLVAGTIHAASALSIEGIHLTLTFVDVRASVNTTVIPFAKVEIVFHHTQDTCHLAKNQNLVPVLVQPGQHAIQKSKLSTGPYQELRMRCPKVGTGSRINRFSKKERVVNVLSVVHEFVRLAESATVLDPLTNQSVTESPLVDQISVTCLQLRDTRVNHHFFLRWQFRKYIHLDAAKQKRAKNLVKFGDRLILSLLHENHFFRRRSSGFLPNVFKSKPRLKDGQIVEDLRVYKVEQTP